MAAITYAASRANLLTGIAMLVTNHTRPPTLIRAMRHVLIASASVVVLWLAACGSQHSTAAEHAAILELYEAQRRAHFQQDAQLFLAAVDTGYLSIVNGVVQYRRKEDALEGVADYFRQTRFDEVLDLSPPRVMLASDGRTAALIGEVEVRGVQQQSGGVERAVAFRAAWLDLYEKGTSGWRLVARANTQRDVP
jgi:hypothetical protein